MLDKKLYARHIVTPKSQERPRVGVGILALNDHSYLFSFFLTILLVGISSIRAETSEVLALDIIPYEKLVEGYPIALQVLNSALHHKGIVGVRGAPSYTMPDVGHNPEHHVRSGTGTRLVFNATLLNKDAYEL